MQRFRRVLRTILLCFCCGYVTSARGECEDRRDHSFRNAMGYVPMLVTAPLSIAATAVGYTVDGVVRIAEPVLITGLICLPVVVVLASAHSSIGFQCFHNTGLEEVWSRSSNETYVGSTIWRGTKAMRCPL